MNFIKKIFSSDNARALDKIGKIADNLLEQQYHFVL